MMENEENSVGYYAVLPATVLYNDKLKANTKLLYAIITSLANKKGFCYASNQYLGQKLGVDQRTITRLLSELRNNNFIIIEIIKNDNREIIKRKIYPQDIPYGQNCRYSYSQNCLYPIDKNVEENNIITNNINTHIEAKKKFDEKVYLFEYEYQELVKLYGKEKTHNCIYELNLYKKEKGVEYYSDYDAIKRWVIKRVDEQAKKNDMQIRNTETKKSFADNYEQREHLDDYWNQFYIN